MEDKVTKRELNLVKSEVIQEYLESRGIHSSARKHLNELIRKAVDDDKTRALIEAGRPVSIRPTRKSWQGNVWIYLMVGIVIGVASTLIVNLILG